MMYTCWVCGELVKEDEWDEKWFEKHDDFIHESCRDMADYLGPKGYHVMQKISELKDLMLDHQQEIKRFVELVEKLERSGEWWNDGARNDKWLRRRKCKFIVEPEKE